MKTADRIVDDAMALPAAPSLQDLRARRDELERGTVEGLDGAGVIAELRQSGSQGKSSQTKNP